VSPRRKKIIRPRYPIYVPSKGRSDILLTANTFDEDETPYRVVVEPQEAEVYASVVGEDRILTLPENDRGLVYSRNWIKEHSIAEGHERHWQFDDDIRNITRVFKAYKLRADPSPILAAVEDFVDRYENVALASLNSEFFYPLRNRVSETSLPPFYLNYRCYTCFLMLNSLPNRWRHRYNEDTDMSLQVLADGWCTVLFNAFLINTPETMTAKGGQMGVYENDGRLQMARQLERVWPGVVETKRRWNRPQHKIKGLWKYFDTPLKRRTDVDWKNLERGGDDEFGMKATALQEIRDPKLRQVMEDLDD